LFALKYISHIVSHCCNVIQLTLNTLLLSKVTIHQLDSICNVIALFVYTNSQLQLFVFHNVGPFVVILVQLLLKAIVLPLYHATLDSIYIVSVSGNNVVYTLATHPLFTKSLNFVYVESELSVIHTSTFQFVIIPLLSNSYVTLSIVTVSQSVGFQLYVNFHTAFSCLLCLGSVSFIQIFELSIHFTTFLSWVHISILFFTVIQLSVIFPYSQLLSTIDIFLFHVLFDLK